MEKVNHLSKNRLMKIDIVVGGQFGSEGKGKVTYYLAKRSKHKCVIRIGGSNSGHTINKIILRHLPASVLLPKGICIIGPGSYLNVKILLNEIKNYSPYKLYIHEAAVIIDNCRKKSLYLAKAIGSTESGTGNAVINRIERKTTLSTIKNIKPLKKYIVNSNQLQDIISKGCIIEGTQGFGLSLLHSPYYPYVTSRDTTAAGFTSEVGISPRDIKNIYLVIRTYPIRVGGNSGPLPKECTWKNLGLNPEYTSVTNRKRRIAKFNSDIVKKAISCNNPTHIILNHLDYIHKNNRKTFIKNVEISINRKIDFIGLGPKKIIQIKNGKNKFFDNCLYI